MSEQAGLRLAYDAVERTVGPRLEALVRTGGFAHSTAIAARARGLMGKPLNVVTARVWHMANLPAQTCSDCGCRSGSSTGRYGG